MDHARIQTKYYLHCFRFLCCLLQLIILSGQSLKQDLCVASQYGPKASCLNSTEGFIKSDDSSIDRKLHIIMNDGKFSTEKLIEALGNKDDSKYPNPPMSLSLRITGIANSTHFEMDYYDGFKSMSANNLDLCVMKRPWWKISKEEFLGNDFSIELTRYPNVWKSYFDAVVETQYGNQSHCSKTPLIVGIRNGIHPGMAIITEDALKKMAHRFSIVSHYFPSSKADKSPQWINNNDCPTHIKNSWECAFIPMTNCVYPKALQDCEDEPCLETLRRSGHHLEFSSATQDGMAKTFNDDSKMNFFYSNFAPGKFLVDISPLILKKTEPTFQVETAEAVIFTQTFMLRPIASYRRLMRHYINSLYTDGFTPTSPCIAVHVRRGDRVVENYNMSEWCYNATHGLPCGSDGVPCSPSPDLGCNTGNTPYGTISLKDVIENVGLLDQSIKDILVLSDDPLWLHRQITDMKSFAPQFKFHTFSFSEYKMSDSSRKASDNAYNNNNANNATANNNAIDITALDAMQRHRNYHLFRSRHRDAGVRLQASLKAVQQCSAFMGHFGSAMTRMMWSAMCVESGMYYGICPPAFSFGN